METKIQALATHLKVDALTIKQVTDKLYEAEGCEFLVLNDDEADEAARDYILETVWAFNAEFIASHSREELDHHAIKAINEMQAKLCESANPIIKCLIKDLDFFVKDAIRVDGRGHFINSYDGEEHAIKIDEEWFYIYRIN